MDNAQSLGTASCQMRASLGVDEVRAHIGKAKSSQRALL